MSLIYECNFHGFQLESSSNYNITAAIFLVVLIVLQFIISLDHKDDATTLMTIKMRS